MLKFSGCSCLTSGRKPKRRPARAFMEAKTSNEGMQPAKVTYQIGTRLSLLGESSFHSANVFQLTGSLIGKTGRPDPINYP